MRRICLAVLTAALAAAGCGESGPTEGTVEFKTGNIDQIGPIQNQMMENMKTKAYLKKGTEAAPKAAESKAAESKAAEAPKTETAK